MTDGSPCGRGDGHRGRHRSPATMIRDKERAQANRVIYKTEISAQRRTRYAIKLATDPESLRLTRQEDYQAHADERRDAKREWRKKHPVDSASRAREYRRRNGDKLRAERHGMTLEQLHALLEGQEYFCANARCRVSLREGAYHVDHSHHCCPGKNSCGTCVRGLLCRNCNLSAGQLDDDASRLLGLAEYIKESEGRLRAHDRRLYTTASGGCSR